MPQILVPLDLLVARHQPALEKSLAMLLDRVPEAGGTVTRKDLADLIRAGFGAGLVDAYLHNKFARSNGTMQQGVN